MDMVKIFYRFCHGGSLGFFDELEVIVNKWIETQKVIHDIEIVRIEMGSYDHFGVPSATVLIHYIEQKNINLGRQE